MTSRRTRPTPVPPPYLSQACRSSISARLTAKLAELQTTKRVSRYQGRIGSMHFEMGNQDEKTVAIVGGTRSACDIQFPRSLERSLT